MSIFEENGALKHKNYIQQKKLTLNTLGKKKSADFKILFLFPQKIGVVIWCKSSP